MSAGVRQPRRNEEQVCPREVQAPEELLRLARIPQENPDPVFRVSAEHVLLYHNPAGEKLCRAWGCRTGRKVPAVLRTIVSAALAEGTPAQHEVTFDSRIYWLAVAPSVADGYVNIYARDITDHKQAQEALRQAEQRFRTIFDATSDGIFLHELETLKLTMCNKSCLQMLGYTEEEFMKLSVADIHPDADLPFVHTQIEEFLKGGKPIRRDIRFQRKDGSIFFADVSPDLVLLEGKRYMVVVLKDITERKRMEEELRCYSERLEELVRERTRRLETANAGLQAEITERKRAEEALRQLSRKNEGALRVARMGHWEFDLTTGMFTFNDQYYTLHGTTAQAAGGYQMTAAEFARRYVHPDDAHLVQETIQEAAAVEDPDFQFQAEARILRADGAARWVIVWFRIEKDAQGRTAKLYGVNQDITERKQAEEALRVSEEHYRSLFDNMLNGFAFCRMLFEQNRPVDFTYLEVNRAFENLTGLKNVTGRNVSEVIPGLRETNPELFEIYGRVALTGRPEQLETYVEALGMWFLISVYSPRKEYFVAVFDVITERKRAEEALRRMNEQLEVQVAQRTEDLRRTVGRLRQLTLELSQAEDRERRRIAAILHEDVQQTLAAAKFHLNLLGSETRSAEESQVIVERVKQMLRDAIERSRGLSHELSPAIYQVDLVEILNWLARHMRQKYGLTVRVEAHGQVDSPSEPLKAFLYKVIQELLFNVVKHAGVSEARVRVRRMGSSIYLSVTDGGRGFDPERLERAAGFGLLGIRERVQLLGGRMKIRSGLGRGSRVLIVVPDQGTSGVGVPAEYGHEQAEPGALAQSKRAEES